MYSVRIVHENPKIRLNKIYCETNSINTDQRTVSEIDDNRRLHYARQFNIMKVD